MPTSAGAFLNEPLYLDEVLELSRKMQYKEETRLYIQLHFTPNLGGRNHGCYFEEITAKLFHVQSGFNDKFSLNGIDMTKLDNDPGLLKAAIEVLSAFERLSVDVNAGGWCKYCLSDVLSP